MKILRLKVENITSLRGHHELDLDQLLGDDGLFAITGPTGSGKSSLLTSISLALFGQGHKSKLNGSDYVSTNAPFGEIELEFLFMNRSYKAVWNCKMVGTRGRPLARPIITRALYDDTGPLDVGPEQLLNLSYDQFTKTVILNQGEFARFLTSNFTERKKILEALYDGDQLQYLGQILKSEIKELHNHKQGLETTLENILPMSEKEYTTLKLSVSETETQLQDYQSYIKSLNKLNDLFKGILTLFKDTEKNQEKIQKYKADLLEKEGLFYESQLSFHGVQKKIEEYNNLIKEARPHLENALKSEQNRQHLEKEIKGIIEQKKLAAKVIKDFTEQEGHLKEQLENNRKKSDVLQEQLPKTCLSLESDRLKGLINTVTEAIQVKEVLKDKTTSVEQLSVRLKEITSRGEALKKEKGELKKSLTIEHGSLEGLKRKQQELTALLSGRERLEEEISELENSISEGQLKKSEYEELLKQTRREEMRLKGSLEKDALVLENHKLKILLYELSLKNSEQDHCLLCHAPLNENKKPHDHPGDQITQVQEQWTQNEQKLRDVTEEGNKQNLYLGHVNEQIQKRAQELEKRRQKLKQTPSRSSLETQLATYEQLIHQVHQFEVKRSGIDSKLESERHHYQELSQEFNILTKTKNLYNERYSSMRDQLKSYLNDQDLLQLESIETPLKQFYELLLERSGLLSKLEFVQKGLAKEQTHLDHYETKLNDHTNEIIHLKSDWNSHWTELITLVSPLNLPNIGQSPTELNHQLDLYIDRKREELKQREKLYLDNKRSKEQVEQLLKSLDEYFEQATQTLKVHQGSIQELINEKELSSFFKRFPELHRPLSKIIDYSAETHKIIPPSLTYSIIDTLHQDSFLPKYEQSLKEHDSLKHELQEGQIRLKLYEERLEKRSQFIKELTSVQEKLALKERLAMVLGRDEFRNFALGLIEAELLAMTNHELRSLCDGRYQIKSTKTTFGQDFTLIDYWDAGAQRKVETLSGGETFLVSLAMSLSLAEMCRGATEIDCFFIDEGFGSLDQDSLDDVLDVLHAIRSRANSLALSHILKLSLTAFPSQSGFLKTNGVNPSSRWNKKGPR